MARDVLIQPRKVTVQSTLRAKVAEQTTLDAGSDPSKLQANELAVSELGYAFVASNSGTKIIDTAGTGTVDTKMIPILTPVDILPKFSLGFNSTAITDVIASNILMETVDINTSVNVTKHKQMSLLNLKTWINASIAGDIENVGKVKIEEEDTNYGYLRQKLSGSASTTFSPIQITLVVNGTGTAKKLAFGGELSTSAQFKIDASNLNSLTIQSISGGTL